MNRSSFGLVALAAAMAACGPGGAAPGAGGLGGGSTGGGEMGGQCSGDFGASAAAQKLEAFLLATAKFTGTAAELESSLLEKCKEMAEELGVPESELQPHGQQTATQAACGAAAAKLQSELRDLRAEANLRISIVASPPRCEVKMDAYAQCAGECQADVDPGQVNLECEGGEIVGTCSGQCQGQCSVEVEGQCRGECQGSCSGGCTGVCQGGCDGRCSAQGANGQCNGRCDGTCQGTCSAGCRGSCEGECWVSGQASCEGECRGGCSVEYQEPRCTGEVRAPRVDAQCKASCDARLNAEAECEPGHAEVTVTGNVGSNVRDRVEKLKTAIRASWGTILAVGAKLQRLAAAGEEMARAAGDVPGAVGDLGLAAGACASQAAAAIPRATASVSVSVEVSASMSASASGG